MLISLGYSCQTRFIIDLMGEAANRRMPFDFNITTRAALLRAIRTDGASLRQVAAAARIFTEPKEARQGVEIGGMYFWHDYPLDEAKLRLRPGWQDDMARVDEKYAALWQRFTALARGEESKTFFLSNTQHNLGQFEGDDDFPKRFGLGRQAFDGISSALEGLGARNYTLRFLGRSVADVVETADIDDIRLDHRFAGKLSLRPDPAILSRIFADPAGAVPQEVFGSYADGGWNIEPLSRHRALIRRRQDDAMVPDGILTASRIGLTAAFEGRDRVFGVAHERSGLLFSDGTRWSKA